MDKETEKEIIEKAVGHWHRNQDAHEESLTDYIFEQLEEVRRIKKKVDRFHHEIRNIRERCNNEVSEVELKVSEVRAECPHPVVEYFPDASGNNDSWYQCKICGKESRTRLGNDNE